MENPAAQSRNPIPALVRKIIATAPGWSWAGPLLRIPAGIIFMGHGGQKLFGLFGGHGLEKTAQFMASLGLEPGYLMALLAGSAEFFGGMLLVLGLMTRVAGFFTLVTMLVAAFAVHVGNGLFVSQGGYEFAMILAAASAALMLQGGGRLSMDNALAGNRS